MTRQTESPLPGDGVAAPVLAALSAAAQAVLGAAWGCLPAVAAVDEGHFRLNPQAPAGLVHASALPVSVAGMPWELQLATTGEGVAGLLPRMLGRAATVEEAESLGAELVAELLNQIAGHWAGLLGEQGVAVVLGTPVPCAATAPASVTDSATTHVTAAVAGDRSAAAPGGFAVHWTYAGQPLLLSSCATAGSLS